MKKSLNQNKSSKIKEPNNIQRIVIVGVIILLFMVFLDIMI